DRAGGVARPPTDRRANEHQVADQESQELNVSETKLRRHEEGADRDPAEGEVFPGCRALPEKRVREEDGEQGLAVREQHGIRSGRPLEPVEVDDRRGHGPDYAGQGEERPIGTSDPQPSQARRQRNRGNELDEQRDDERMNLGQDALREARPDAEEDRRDDDGEIAAGPLRDLHNSGPDNGRDILEILWTEGLR